MWGAEGVLLGDASLDGHRVSSGQQDSAVLGLGAVTPYSCPWTVPRRLQGQWPSSQLSVWGPLSLHYLQDECRLVAEY